MGVLIEHDFRSSYSILSEVASFYMDYINERIKVLSYKYVSESMAQNLIDLAEERGFGKVESHCSAKHLKLFKDAGYVIEGNVRGYFKGVDAYCVSYFLDKSRMQSRNMPLEDKILRDCIDANLSADTEKKRFYKIRNAAESDIPQMIRLYTEVFCVYPAPVFDVEFYNRIIKGNTICKVAVVKEKIIGIAAAHTDKENLNAEITGCVTSEEYRNKGVISELLYSLESDLRRRGYCSLYGLSPAMSPSMNRIFKKHEYGYGGRLINNNSVMGHFEDMNIWTKPLYNAKDGGEQH